MMSQQKIADAVGELITVARDLVAGAHCNCTYCWTSRGRHDPQGCTWEDIADLREAVEAYEKAIGER